MDDEKQEQQLPLEIVVDNIKRYIAKYIVGLCQQYQIPGSVAILILQEIIYENKLNAYTSIVDDLVTSSNQKYNIDIPLNGSDDVNVTE